MANSGQVDLQKLEEVIRAYLTVLENVNGKSITRGDLASNNAEKYDLYLGGLIPYLSDPHIGCGYFSAEDIHRTFNNELVKDRNLL